jgi:hypothetical protein
MRSNGRRAFGTFQGDVQSGRPEVAYVVSLQAAGTSRFHRGITKECKSEPDGVEACGVLFRPLIGSMPPPVCSPRREKH